MSKLSCFCFWFEQPTSEFHQHAQVYGLIFILKTDSETGSNIFYKIKCVKTVKCLPIVAFRQIQSYLNLNYVIWL